MLGYFATHQKNMTHSASGFSNLQGSQWRCTVASGTTHPSCRYERLTETPIYKAPQYLMDCCTRTSDVSSCQRLRSANRHQLMVPRHRRSTFGRRAFSVAGPMQWNSLPHSLWNPAQSTGGFISALKTHLFAVQRAN